MRSNPSTSVVSRDKAYVRRLLVHLWDKAPDGNGLCKETLILVLRGLVPQRGMRVVCSRLVCCSRNLWQWLSKCHREARTSPHNLQTPAPSGTLCYLAPASKSFTTSPQTILSAKEQTLKRGSVGDSSKSQCNTMCYCRQNIQGLNQKRRGGSFEGVVI